MTIHLKNNNGGVIEAEEHVKDCKLLKRIDSTIEKQKETDRKEIDRSTATLPVFVEKAYSKSELLLVWSEIEGIFDENQWSNLPEVEKIQSHIYPMQSTRQGRS